MNTKNHHESVAQSSEKLIRLKAPRICRRCGLPPSEVEMIEQDLRVHLWLIRDSIDPTQDAQGSEAFIDTVLNHRGTTLARYFHAKKRDPGCEVCSLDDGDVSIEAGGVTEDQRDLRMDLKAVIAGLPYHLLQVLWAKRDGRLVELANQPGWSRRILDERHAMLIRVCEDAGLDIYL